MNKLVFLAVGLSVCGHVHAYKAYEERIQRAQTGFADFLASAQELRDDQHFLYSLKEPVRPAQLEEIATNYQMQVQAVHLCANQGVLAIFVNATDSIVRRVEETDLSESMRTLSRPLSPDELGKDLVRGDIKLCGFEAKMSSVNAKRLSLDFGGKILSVEIETKRKRLLPINHTLKDAEEKAQ